jgi:hypothetical protein
MGSKVAFLPKGDEKFIPPFFNAVNASAGGKSSFGK